MSILEKINVKELVISEMGASKNVVIEGELADQDLPEGITLLSLNGKVKLTRLEDTILVHGQIRAMIGASCGKCLEKTEKTVDFELEREYEIDRKAESEENLYVDKYLNIDLDESIREELILAIPSRIVCQEDCQGLCQKCGGNLNKKECKCNS